VDSLIVQQQPCGWPLLQIIWEASGPQVAPYNLPSWVPQSVPQHANFIVSNLD